MISESKDVMGECIPYLVVIMPVLLLLSSTTPVSAISPTAASTPTASPSAGHMYLVYRVHQIEIFNRELGSKSSTINLEGIAPTHLSDSNIRRCALFKFADILNERNELFIDKILGEALVSGVLIIFKNITTDLTRRELDNLHKIEERLLSTDVNLPIYLINENEYIEQLYDEYNQQAVNTKTMSLMELFQKHIFFDSHQFVISGPSVKSVDSPIVTCFEAKLLGTGIESQLPNYAIVAHYDSYSIVPNLSFGADSNGSGLVILLELFRVFAKLYSSNKTRPKANVYFFISGGGKENYFGTKKWVEHYNQADAVIESPLKKMDFVLCLDSLAGTLDADRFYMHVARFPKAGTPPANFYDTFGSILAVRHPSTNLTQVHNRINMAEFAWEHEPFSVHKVPAFTLSHLGTSTTPVRRSLADVYQERYVANLVRNAQLISETFGQLLFPDVQGAANIAQTPELAISASFVRSMFKYFTNTSRHQQLLLTKPKQNQLPSMLLTIESVLRKFSDSLSVHHFKVSAASPEFTFYGPVQSEMSIYNMKPAAFDLLVTMVILAYLGLVYLLVKNYHLLDSVARALNLDRLVSRLDNFKTKTK